MSDTPQNGEDKIFISRSTYDQFKEMGADLILLRKENKQHKELIANYKIAYELVAYCIFGLTGAFGMNGENGMIRPEILSNEENPMGSLLKEMGTLMADAMLAEGGNKRAKEKLEQKFHFFRFLPAVVEFYQHQQGIKIEIPAELLANLPESVIAKLKTA